MLCGLLKWLTVRVLFTVREFDVFFFTPYRAALRSIEPLIQWVQEALSANIISPSAVKTKDTSTFCSEYYSAIAPFI